MMAGVRLPAALFFQEEGGREVTHAYGARKKVDEEAMHEIVLNRTCRRKRLLAND